MRRRHFALTTAALSALGLARWSAGADPADPDVPPPAAFDRVLRRDVLAWARTLDARVDAVEVTLLREGPTVTGISFPKYYAWVRATAAHRAVAEGAVRLAAIEGEHFEIRNFLSAADARSTPERIGMIFPTPLLQAIRERAAKAP